MYQNKLPLELDPYCEIEVSSRIYNRDERIMFTITGRSNNNEAVSASAILTDNDLDTLISILNEAKLRKKVTLDMIKK